MSHLFSSLATLACPIGMGLMMWMMMRGGKKTGASPGETAKQAELDQLHAQIDEMRARQSTQTTSTPDLPAR